MKLVKKYWIIENQKKLNTDSKISDNLKLIKIDGVIRCQGRFSNLRNENMPVVLSRSHPTTKLFILDAHKRVYHNGLKSTLVEFRQEFY